MKTESEKATYSIKKQRISLCQCGIQLELIEKLSKALAEDINSNQGLSGAERKTEAARLIRQLNRPDGLTFGLIAEVLVFLNMRLVYKLETLQKGEE